MLLDIQGLDGPESAETDMKRNKRGINALFSYTLKQFIGKCSPAVGAAAEPGTLNRLSDNGLDFPNTF